MDFNVGIGDVVNLGLLVIAIVALMTRMKEKISSLEKTVEDIRTENCTQWDELVRKDVFKSTMTPIHKQLEEISTNVNTLLGRRRGDST